MDCANCTTLNKVQSSELYTLWVIHMVSELYLKAVIFKLYVTFNILKIISLTKRNFQFFGFKPLQILYICDLIEVENWVKRGPLGSTLEMVIIDHLSCINVDSK